MGKLKDQLAGIAALIAAIVAIGGGFVKYGEIVTKLDAIEAQEHSTVDTSSIESAIAVLEEKVSKLENPFKHDLSSDQFGCKSWFKINLKSSLKGNTVLTEPQFNKKKELIKKVLLE